MYLRRLELGISQPNGFLCIRRRERYIHVYTYTYRYNLGSRKTGSVLSV